MERTITCIRVGCYEGHLTRGQKYNMIAQDTDKNQVRVHGDSGRTRWFPSSCFDLTGEASVPVLVSWQFDDPVITAGFWIGDTFIEPCDETCNCVDATLEFSDGTTRWCILLTPDYLKRLLHPRSEPQKWGGASEPAVWGAHIIVVRDLFETTVNWTLKYMDQQGELFRHSRATSEER